jgi:DNA-binding response OmpR family regulator
MLTALLSQLGHKIETRPNCAEALRTARDGGADLYILDTRLPDCSGYELCQQLLQVAPDTPVIFYSGAASDGDRAKGLAAGACAYLVKPTVDDLLATVAHLLPAHSDG